MKIGIDSSVIVAAVHANHPHHALATNWLVQSLKDHHLVVCHHSILESYAVLTRLPGELRVTPSEARDLLTATVQANMSVAGFQADSIWTMIESLAMSSVVGGHSYDAFIIEVLHSCAVEAVATFNPAHFSNLADDLQVIDPAKPRE